MYSPRKTLVVLCVPGQPLIARRLDEMPMTALGQGSVYYIDGTAYQQTAPTRIALGRDLKGQVTESNALLQAMLKKMYGGAEMLKILDKGILNVGEDTAADSSGSLKGLISVSHGLKPDVEDLILLPCRILSDREQRLEKESALVLGALELMNFAATSTASGSRKDTQTKETKRKPQKKD